MSKTEEINNMIKENKQLRVISTKDIGDGYHTFDELYEQKIVLFSVICNSYPKLSWKSKKHFDEENDPMFNGCFIVGINTPKGVATYHFKLKYWNEFDIPELECAPKYDGYSSDEVLTRIKSLKNKKHEKNRRYREMV